MGLNPSYLGIIPARCGSKRIPNKNILEIAAKPLIAWTIEAALGAKNLDRVVVSTDCKAVANVAKDWGADVPFIRPKDLAEDNSNVVDAVLHAVEFFEQQGQLFDYVVILQPTSPLRKAHDIENAITLQQEKSANAIVSVCQSDASLEWIKVLPESMDMSEFSKELAQYRRSQDFEAAYRLNGSIYVISVEKLRECKTVYLKENIFAFPMSRYDSVDIDEMEDFYMAEALLNAQRSLYKE